MSIPTLLSLPDDRISFRAAETSFLPTERRAPCRRSPFRVYTAFNHDLWYREPRRRDRGRRIVLENVHLNRRVRVRAGQKSTNGLRYVMKTLHSTSRYRFFLIDTCGLAVTISCYTQMSLASPPYQTSLPTLHHLMLGSPLHVPTPTPTFNLLLDPYSRDFSHRHGTNMSVSPTSTSRALEHLHLPHPDGWERPNAVGVGIASSSSSSSSRQASPPSSSSTERESRDASSSSPLRKPSSSSNSKPTRRALMSRRANACHSCRIRKTRCVPSNDRRTATTARSPFSSSSSSSRSGRVIIAPCIRCSLAGVSCEYPNTQGDKVEMQSQRRCDRIQDERDERDLEDLGHWLVPNSSSRRPVRSTFNELKHRDSGGRTAHIDGAHIGDAMTPLSIDDFAITNGPSSSSRHTSSQGHSWSSERMPSPSPFISQRPRGDVSPKTIAFDP